MKPLKLRIKGLNSFKEEQIIDFQRLTDSGLFGIFGPTGCGKSSILDAITYALYGKIIRDNSGFINITEESVEVSYEFEIGAGRDRKTFIVDRAAKKEKKKEGYKTTVVRLREKVEDCISIASEGKLEVDKNIEGVIGLTLEDFTRAVVLPQGKFSEFLKTKPSDRRDMLERIFGLQRYGRGLGEKIKLSRRSNKERLLELDGKLSQYSTVSEEGLSRLKEEYASLIEEEKLLKEAKTILDDKYEKFKAVWELQEELKVYEDRYNDLMKSSDVMMEKKESFEKGVKALSIKPMSMEVEAAEGNIAKNTKELEHIIIAMEQGRDKLKVTEQKYIKALEAKTKEYPEFIKIEARLNEALRLKAELIKQEADIKSLEEEYRSINKNASALNEEIGEINKRREQINSLLSEILRKIINVKIEPEYRESLQKANDVEKEYKNIVEAIEDLRKKYNSYETELKNSREQYTPAAAKQLEKSNELKMLSERLEALEKSCPGDNELLLQRLEQINSLEKQYNESEANSIKAEQLGARLGICEAKKLEIESSLEAGRKELEARTQELKAAEEEIERIKINNVASLLASQLKQGDACPVCGSEHFVKLADPIDEALIKEQSTIKEQLQNTIEQLNAIIRGKELEQASINSDYEYIKKEASDLIEKLQGIELSSLKHSLEQQKEEFDALKASMEQWKNEKDKCERAISLVKEERSKLDAELATLSESISKDEKLISSLREELLRKHNECKVIEENYENFKKELGIESFKERMDEVFKMDMELKKLQKNEGELRDNLAALDKLREEKEEIKNQCLQALERIKQSGTEKREAINNKKKDMGNLSEGREPEEYILEVRSSIAFINENEERARKLLDNEKNAQQRLQENRAALEKNMETLEGIFKTQRNKLLDMLNANNFESLEEALGCYIEKPKLEVLEKEVKFYEEQLRDCSLNLERVRKKLKGDSIEEEQWKALLEEKAEKEQLLESKQEERAKKQKELKDMEDNLSKVSELLAEKKEYEHKESLLGELEKMVQGNKLVEFVAMNQLKYVASEASKRLKDITRGRYALELDESGGFIMRDDFNGGLRRSTSSLSGGETFLTSLSLALALSSQIQLKGRSPLEFFFLDEGFGTLDSELLDTVMDSLERLRSEKLSVGIISHVEELKSRVPIKLLVTPAQPGEGTRVRIENS